MNYFLAIVNEHATDIKIITEDKVLDDKLVSLPNNEYVRALADEIIELSHQNNLYHNDIKRIGLKVDDISLIGYGDIKSLHRDLESTFGFEAVINDDYEALLVQLTK